MRQLWKLRTTARAVAMAAAVSMATGPTGAGLALAHGHDSDTTTPIEHVVVIFQENVSFDHYFATYPNATNVDGTAFSPKAGTPIVNGLFTNGLLTTNPNSALPFRLSRSEAITCDQDHNYNDEQKAFNGRAMNKFVQHTG